jgi:GNAT superfamily N-acetyltransferase
MSEVVSGKHQQIIELEWANYAATRMPARVTPGLDLVLRDDVVITGSRLLPIPDANHACLVRSSEWAVEDLIAEVIAHFRERGVSPTFYLSPACVPDDLPERLTARGFSRQPDEEAWMILPDILDLEVPRPTPNVVVQSIEREEVPLFVGVFLEAFGMPSEFAPPFVELLEPSVGLEHAWHCMAYDGDQPIGTCSLLTYEQYGVLGSAGIVRSRRGRGAATNMVIAAVAEARRRGVNTLMLQTTAGTLLERFLRIRGFERIFTRTCYVLSESAD